MPFIIVTGMGRTGQTFLANLLDHAENVEARNEYFGDKNYMALSYYRPTHPFLEMRLRQQRKQLQVGFPEDQIFVDTNQWLRYSLDSVRRTLDGALCFQLVRNVRDVVRSYYITKIYTVWERDMPVIPNNPSTLKSWEGFTRFEKLCWYWNDPVCRLLQEGVPLLHLERIVSDYNYLREHLLQPCGFRLGLDVWHALKDKKTPHSRSRLKTFKKVLRGQPVELKWTPEHEERFMAICGETMRALGYE